MVTVSAIFTGKNQIKKQERMVKGPSSPIVQQIVDRDLLFPGCYFSGFSHNTGKLDGIPGEPFGCQPTLSALIFSASGSPRKVMTPSRSLPSMGGINELEPVAIYSLSYLNSSPLDDKTVFFTASILTTSSLTTRIPIPWSILSGTTIEALVARPAITWGSAHLTIKNSSYRII